MSALAANPQLLLNLQGLVDAGHLNPEEFAAEKKKLFDAPLYPPSNAVVDTLSSITLATQAICATQVELFRYLHGCRTTHIQQPWVTPSGVSPMWIPSPMCPGSTSSLSTSIEGTKRTRSMPTDTVHRPQGQQSLFNLGVTTVPTDPGEADRQKKKPKTRLVSGKFLCPKCSFVADKQGPLAMHIKHVHPTIDRGGQSVETMWLKRMTPEQRAAHGQRVLDRARDVEIAFIVKDIMSATLDTIVRHDLPTPAWLPRVCDGRIYNRGAQRRKLRSIAFKSKVIQDYEMYMKQLGDDVKGQVASIVADIWDLNKHQVNDFVRNKEHILAQSRWLTPHPAIDCVCDSACVCRNRKLRGQCRERRRMGMFPRAEKVVYDMFASHRKQGRPVGPKFLRQAMRREVAKIASNPANSLKQRHAARAFRGGAQWLSRFAKRWGLCLRRKTNVKKIPIQERAKKIKRWMALFRLYLQSFKARIPPPCMTTPPLVDESTRWCKPSMKPCRPRQVRVCRQGSSCLVCFVGFVGHSPPNVDRPRCYCSPATFTVA